MEHDLGKRKKETILFTCYNMKTQLSTTEGSLKQNAQVRIKVQQKVTKGY